MTACLTLKCTMMELGIPFSKTVLIQISLLLRNKMMWSLNVFPTACKCMLITSKRMIRKYHNYTLQSNQRHREEEPHPAN